MPRPKPLERLPNAPARRARTVRSRARDGRWLRVLTGGAGALAYVLLLGAVEAVTSWSLLRWAPPFGASLVMLFFSRADPQAKRWTVMVGHTVGAVSGGALALLLAKTPVFVHATLAVPTTVFGMLATRSFHPAACITALMIALAPKEALGDTMVAVLANGAGLMLVHGVLDGALTRYLQRSDGDERC